MINLSEKNKLINAMKFAVSVGLALGAGILAGKKLTELKKTDDRLYAEKHLAIILLYNQWMKTKQEGKSVAKYLHDSGIRTVAIYGMSYAGERLYDELKNSEVEVKYAIDRNAEGIYSEVEVLRPEDKLPDVDMIIVTAVYFYGQIAESLGKVTDCNISSLEDILYEM